MVTKTIAVKGGEYAVEPDGRIRPVATYYGMASDPKPIEGVRDADRYLEKDTKKLFIFDEDGKDGDPWLPWSR